MSVGYRTHLFDFRELDGAYSNKRAPMLRMGGSGGSSGTADSIKFQYHVTGSDRIQSSIQTPEIENQWFHIDIFINSGTTTMYVNGVSEGTWSDSTNYNELDKLWIGRHGYSGNHNFTGWISNFRVVNGTAVYTSNFTPGSIGSKTTYTTTGSNSLNITGQVVSLLDPDVELVGTDMSTSDTVSNNGFNDFGFLPGNATSKDVPDNNFCQFSGVGGSKSTGDEYSVLTHASGFTGDWPNSQKACSVGNIGVTKGKWYWEVIDGQNNIGCLLYTSPSPRDS